MWEQPSARVAGPTLSESGWGKQLTRRLSPQYFSRVRPERWADDQFGVKGAQCPRKEHCGGASTLPSNGPAPGPQNLLDEEVLRSKAGDHNCMNGHVVDNACCCQHGVIKDRGEAGATNAKEGAIPPSNRGREWGGDTRAMYGVFDVVAIFCATLLARGWSLLKASRGQQPITHEPDRGQHYVGL